MNLCTFDVAGQRFGIDTARVQEVVRVAGVTPVPGAPADVHGLLSLRGMIVLAVDTARRLALHDPGRDRGTPADGSADALPTDTTGMVAVVLPAPEGPVALLVDDVHEIVAVDAALFEPSSDQHGEHTAALVAGAYRTLRQLTLLLDVDAVLAAGLDDPAVG